MTCSECGAEMYREVDGVEMTMQEILTLPDPPQEIKYRMNHKLWCSHIRGHNAWN